MKPLAHCTKIVATFGPASDSPEVMREMLRAGLNVARLNFSHGNYEDHAERIQQLRAAATEVMHNKETSEPQYDAISYYGQGQSLGDVGPKGVTPC